LGHFINNAQDANLGAITSAATKRAGTETETLTQQAGKELWDKLDQAGNAFRNSNPVRVGKVSTDLKDAADKVRQYAAATGQTGDLAKLTRPSNVLGDVAPPNPTAQQLATPGYVGPMPKERVLPASDVMDLRRAASELAYNEQDPVLRQQLRAYRDSLDEAYKKANPAAPDVKEHPFDKWRREWGAAEDVRKAADSGLERGHLTPANIEKTLSDRARGGAPGMTSAPGAADFEKMIVAAKDRFKTPPAGENRALLTALMLGGGAGIGLGVDKLTDSPVTGVAAGVGGPALAATLLGSAAGGRYLTGTAKNQAYYAALARMLAAGGGGAIAANKSAK
jgi:hypothetical protein